MNITNFQHCFGCGVCAAACPKNAIKIKINEAGFLQPYVNECCIDCGICIDVCAFNNSEVCKTKDCIEPYCFAGWSKDKDVRLQCTSGGVVYEIEKHALAEDYSVVGVRYDIDNRKSEHYIATNEQELQDSIGSKYIQSDTTVAFSKLEKGKKYLVVGTPCQIDSLRHYIRKKGIEDNFVLMDFFCHSVPSVKMWYKYLDMVGYKKYDEVLFRCKRNGWHESTTICIKGDGQEWYSPLSKGDLFYWFFLGERCPNPACIHDCKYKQQSSAADIRVGDLWGYKYLKNEEGVNAVVAFTKKGKETLDNIKTCIFEPCDFSTVAELQRKSNVHPKRSYSYVLKSLATAKSLRGIKRIACLIEIRDLFPQIMKYYWKRLPYKLGVLK